MSVRICIVGAGVIGLSTAVNVIEQVHKLDANIQVHVLADTFSPHTTSDGAAGFWEPYQVGSTPTEDVLRWGRITFQHTMDLCKSQYAKEIGAFPISGYDLHRSKAEVPIYKDIVYGFREMTEHELTQFPDYNNFGMRKIPTLASKALIPAYNVVVNCTGIGARMIVDDFSLKPISGQVTRVRAPWLKTFILAEELYIFPRIDDVVLGGTEGKGNWKTTVDKAAKKQIWDGCLKLIPSLKGSEHISDWVGLRPSRPRVRLERTNTELPGGKLHVIHNYGHGGAGVTLHWGCALEATQLVMEAVEFYINAKSKI